MRVAIVSTAGPGHVRHICDNLPDGCKEHKLFIVRYKDDPIHADADSFTLNVPRPSNVAREFNAARSEKLIDVLHCSIYEYDPHVIIYDFFALEAREVALRMGIPAVCYIPATLKPDEDPGGSCSDGHLPVERMYWVLRPKHDTALPVVKFVRPTIRPRFKCHLHEKDLLVVTFGTVVPRYPEYADKIRSIVADVSRLQDSYAIMFIGLKDYVSDSVETDDLVSFMAVADAVLFHGGGNTYAELMALNKEHIRVVVCPFFGDQFETARQHGCVYSGDIVNDLKNAKPVSGVYTYDRMSIGRFSDYFRPGDLVFGHKHHRIALQRKFPDIDLHLEHFKPFQEFGKGLPAIADVYNDEHLNTQPRPGGEFSDRFEAFARVVGEKPVDHEHELVHRCIKLLELTVFQWNGTIHFVTGPGIGEATRIELQYIEKNWDRLREHVIFYDLEGERTRAPFERPRKERHGHVTQTVTRTKTQESIDEKKERRKLPVLDVFGSRKAYLGLDHKQEVLASVDPSYDIVVESQRGRVFHFYYLSTLTELQVWPFAYLRYFCRDVAQGTKTDRKVQAELQDLIENFCTEKGL